MPTFMESLASNPGGGIYNPYPGSSDDALKIVNQLKDREMQDFKNKAAFMSDLTLQQDRMRRIFDMQYGTKPGEQVGQGSQPGQPGGMNVVMQDPNMMTGYQKGELGIRQAELAMNKEKLAQQGKMGQEALDIRSAQQKLNQQKSDQINAQKQADLERKIEESNKKIQLAQDALNQRTTSAEAQLQLRRDLADAVEARHKLEIEMKQHQFDITNEQHQQQIKALEEKVKQAGRSKTTTQISPEGNTKTVTTERGSAVGAPIKNPDGTYTVTAPDGTKGIIPGDKIDDWMENYHPGEQ